MPDSDAHLVLARHAPATSASDDGPLSCFFVPRYLPDGHYNALTLQRLKDKLGNRSNASAEVEFQGSAGLLIGEPGRGLPLLMEMAGLTRLDCALGSTALMRQALVQALHHARHRQAFGQRLITHPLMCHVLLTLLLETQAALLLTLRLAHACALPHDPLQNAWRRILVPAAKFWICRRAVDLTAEALEIWGGNGYVEEGPMARLYREAPVNSVWEGAGNVMCLDVLRALQREPEAAYLLLADLRRQSDGQAAMLAALQQLETLLRLPAAQQTTQARQITQILACLAQAGLMGQHTDARCAAWFVHSRFDRMQGWVAGTLPEVCPELAATLLEQAFPV